MTERPPDTCDLLAIDVARAETLRAQRLPVDVLDRLAEGARAMGDPTRLALALALQEDTELCVCDLAWIVEREQKLVSHHLRLLRGAGLAQSRRAGKMVMYSLTPEGRSLLAAMTADRVA